MKKLVNLYYTTQYQEEIDVEELAEKWGMEVEDITEEDLVQMARESSNYEDQICSNLIEVGHDVEDCAYES